MKYEDPDLPPPPAGVEVPPWVLSNSPEGGKVCGVGIAGRAFFKESEAPKNLAKDRAIRNLAGIFESLVLEAQIVHQTETTQNVEFQRAVTVDEDLIAQVAAAASAEFWFDALGAGPMREKEFTYGRACVDATMASEKLGVDQKALEEKAEAEGHQNEVPEWVTSVGTSKGARLCAVGFSQPTFYVEQTLGNVVDDIRGQLLEKAKSLVMDAFEDTLTCKDASCRAFIHDTLAATTEAISKNVVITSLWYDRRGIGPNHAKRTGYGYGCVYPIKAMSLATQAILEEHPEISPETVKEAAEKMFDELESMEAKVAEAPRVPADPAAEADEAPPPRERPDDEPHEGPPPEEEPEDSPTELPIEDGVDELGLPDLVE
ncbi:MAG: hypothetical protein HYV07_33100 [Deltaproteobacteria bacterium]|nr:hypothetical protein [Deltaproteobacteria bacterium]